MSTYAQRYHKAGPLLTHHQPTVNPQKVPKQRGQYRTGPLHIDTLSPPRSTLFYPRPTKTELLTQQHHTKAAAQIGSRVTAFIIAAGATALASEQLTIAASLLQYQLMYLLS